MVRSIVLGVTVGLGLGVSVAAQEAGRVFSWSAAEQAPVGGVAGGPGLSVIALDPLSVGYGLLAFVAVTMERPEHRAGFLAKVHALPEVQECHHIAGEDDYLLKVRCRDTADLERVISEELKGVPGVARTRTTISLKAVKETLVVPV